MTDTPVRKFDLRIGWDLPTQREDGIRFDMSEIGGYEIRYRKVSETEFRTIPNLPPTILKYQISNIPYDDYIIEIAVFDCNGLYSAFTPIEYTRPPMPVSKLRLKTSTIR